MRERLDRALTVGDSERADRHVAIEFGRDGFDSAALVNWPILILTWPQNNLSLSQASLIDGRRVPPGKKVSFPGTSRGDGENSRVPRATRQIRATQSITDTHAGLRRRVNQESLSMPTSPESNLED